MADDELNPAENLAESPDGDQNPSEVEELEQSAALRTRIGELESLTAEKDKEIRWANDRLAELEQAVTDRDSEIAALKLTVSELDERIINVNDSLTEAVASYKAMSVRQILEFVLARIGLKLEVKSQSSVITSYYPDFTINPNNSSTTLVRKLLSFVPDVLFIEGNKAYLVNPQSSDNSVYSYGSSHPLLEGRYRKGAWELNRTKVEGYDTGSEEPIIVDSFSWSQIEKGYDRLRQLEDRNIDTVAKAQARGEAYLRESQIDSASGFVLIPVNCGQQLYDVIDITDIRAGLKAEKKRVVGLTLVYNPDRGQYEHRLSLGAV